VGLRGFNDSGSVEVYGYLVPKGDVPSGAVNLTPPIGSKKCSALCEPSAPLNWTAELQMHGNRR
jgi:hypothetical protein